MSKTRGRSAIPVPVRSLSEQARSKLACAFGAGSPDARMWEAIHLRDEDALEGALAAGASPSSLWPGSSQTPMLAAASMGLFRAVRALGAAGASPDHPDGAGRRPLGAAATSLVHGAKEGRSQCVRELLALGADAKLVDSKGAAALMLLAASDPELRPLLPNAKGEELGGASTDGRTPLMAAAKAGNAVAVKGLLAMGVEPSIRDADGHTALSLAAQSGSAKVVKVLAPVSELDFLVGPLDGSSPLMLAVGSGSLACARAMCLAGAKLDFRDGSGGTALMRAAGEGRLGALRMLLAQGADPLLRGKAGTDAMIKAVKAYRSAHQAADCIRALAEAGANADEPWLADSRKASLLMLACERGSAERVQALLDAGADVRLADAQGRQALGWAAREGAEECCMALLKAGADARAKDVRGVDPIGAARARGHEGLAETLAAYALQSEESQALRALGLAASGQRPKPRL